MKDSVDRDLMIKCMEEAKEIWDKVFPKGGKGPYNSTGVATIATELFRWRKTMILVSYPAGTDKEILDQISQVINSSGFAYMLLPDTLKAESITPCKMAMVETEESEKEESEREGTPWKP